MQYDIIYIPLGAQAYGGAERVLMELAAVFAARGYRVLILVGPELARTDFIRVAASKGLATERVDWNHRLSHLHNLRACIATFLRLRARIIHINISWHRDMWMVGLCARVLTRSALIGSMHAMPEPHQLVPRRKYLGFLPGVRLWHLPELAIGWIWGRILHRTITVNAGDYPTRLVTYYHYPPNRLRPIHNGVDLTHRVSEERAESLRRSAGITSDDFLIVMAGRLSREKGGHLLLQAIAPLPARIRLAFVGDGPQRADLEALTDELGQRQRVLFAGFTLHPEDWMAAADVVAVPSVWHEGCGMVVIEAMKEGTPVIASRIGGMTELFQDYIQGRYVPTGNVSVLRSTIAELYDNRNVLNNMSIAARRLVFDRFSLTRVENDYAQEYAELLKQF